MFYYDFIHQMLVSTFCMAFDAIFRIILQSIIFVFIRLFIFWLTAENSMKKKKVYEQQENEENPLRCPVKLYEFYLSKW